jgi:putative aldouronate transport system substrate-binding protein
MKKSKVFLAVLLGMALSVVLVANAWARGSQQGGTGKQKVTFYMLTFNNIPDDYSQVVNVVNQHIATTYPDANIELDLQLVGFAEYNDKIRLAMQGGQPIDIFTTIEISNMIAQNQLLPLENLLQSGGQDLWNIISADMGADVFNVYTKDGHIYAVPVDKGVVVTPTLLYDKDILAKTGYSIDDIKTIRDLPPVFDKVMQLYPDMFPYAGANPQDTYIIPALLGENDVDVLGTRENPMGVVFGNSGKVVNLYEQPVFREYINLMRQWYAKGYLPKDSATSTSRAAEYIAAGRCFSTMAGYGGAEIWVTVSQDSGKNIGSKWIAPYYMDSSTMGVAMGISSTSKNPQAAMKMLDIIYTDEFVINTLLYGIEGVDYVKVDEHHWKFPDGRNSNTVSYTAAYSTGVLGSEKLQLQPAGTSYDDVLLKMRQNRENKRSPYFGFVFDSSPVINELTALSNVYSQYIPGLICGSSDPDVVMPQFIGALKNAGIDRVIAAKQSQLDAWIAVNK